MLAPTGNACIAGKHSLFLQCVGDVGKQCSSLKDIDVADVNDYFGVLFLIEAYTFDMGSPTIV